MIIIRIIEKLQDKPGALLPLLHAVQDELGYIPPEALPVYCLGNCACSPAVRVGEKVYGQVDPVRFDDHVAEVIQQAIGNQQLPLQIVRNGSRGRGGAAFPTGIKWQTVLDSVSEQKFVVCNADEGDSGSYSDRMLMESDPFSLIEGMVIAGLAVGANRGYIYLREEYPLAFEVLNQAIDIANEKGWLGSKIGGSDKCFNLEVRLGAGSCRSWYVLLLAITMLIPAPGFATHPQAMV